MVAKTIVKNITKALNKKGTQPIFKKKFSVKEGSAVDPESMVEPSVARNVGTKGERVTTGSQSTASRSGMLKEQQTQTTRARAKRIAELETKQEKGTITASEKKELSKLNKEEKQRAERATLRGAIASSKTQRSKSPSEVVDVKTGEILDEKAFDKLTPNQQRKLTEQGSLRKAAGLKKGGKVGKPRGVGCATRGYGKAMKCGGSMKGKH
jgi:hypothetical protein